MGEVILTGWKFCVENIMSVLVKLQMCVGDWQAVHKLTKAKLIFIEF